MTQKFNSAVMAEVEKKKKETEPKSRLASIFRKKKAPQEDESPKSNVGIKKILTKLPEHDRTKVKNSDISYKENPVASIAVHVIGGNSIQAEVLEYVEPLQEYETEKISFDSHLQVIEIKRTFSRARPPTPILINQHVWDNFYLNTKYQTGKKVSNHVFLAGYYKDDWLSFERASEAIDSLRKTKFSPGVPSPPIVLLGISRNAITSTAGKSVSAEDATALANKYSAAFVESEIENKRFANKDVYTAITAARPLSDGDEKA